MEPCKIIRCALILLIFLLIENKGYPLSNSVVASDDYKFILENIRVINVIIKNFPDQEIEKNFTNIESGFQAASEDFYSLKYDSAHIKFLKVKSDLILLLDVISINYIERTKKILSFAYEKSFEILIEYGKGGSESAHFQKPFDPINEKKDYEEKNYHFFYDKESIESYLKIGFMLLQSARNLYDDSEIKLMRSNKHLLNKSRDKVIINYMNIINMCRDSKKAGIEILKIVNEDKFLEIVKKFDIDANIILPIYDLRIPEEYRRDANDNLKLVDSIEQKKLLNK